MAVIFHKSLSVSTHKTKKIVAIFPYFWNSLKVISVSWMEVLLPLYCIDIHSQQKQVVIGVTLTTLHNDARLLLAFSPLRELLSSNIQTLCGLFSNCLDIILSKSILSLIEKIDVFIWLQVNYYQHLKNSSKVYFATFPTFVYV